MGDLNDFELPEGHSFEIPSAALTLPGDVFKVLAGILFFRERRAERVCCTNAQLSRFLGMRPGDVRRAIERLEDFGFLRRVPNHSFSQYDFALGFGENANPVSKGGEP